MTRSSVDPERFKRLEQLYYAAGEMQSEQRMRFLDEQCGSDAALRAEVEAMLSYGTTKMEGALRASAGEPIPTRDATSEPDIPRQIGSYTVIRRIGQGGMGNVYLAARTSDFKQQVAIKLIKRGMDTDEILRRFRHERQVMAGLQHANIARLLDGGSTDDGQPYFAMEQIEGVSIDRYCDEQRLTIRDRLRLFQRVCSAVHYAHQHTVIHRDIKPGNILVTTDGTPKIIDFGIAKLTNRELGFQSLNTTQTTHRFMTPEYASPEQVRGRAITTASDVYSLGVVLYELLTGHRPHELTSRLKHEIEQLVCEQVPERPSTAIGRTVEVRQPDGTTRTITSESVGRMRDCAPDKLRRQLSGDLDNIVLMALRKEPHRRYTSAEQFGQDIERHLNNKPVLAAPPSMVYRARKFVQRNRSLVASAAVVLIVLLAGIAISTSQAVRATRAEHLAGNRLREVEESRTEAERQAAIAEAVNAFLNDDLLAAVAPEEQGKDATMRQVLDTASGKIEGRFEDEPLVEASIRTTIGNTYLSLGDYESSEGHLERALNLRKAALDTHHASVLMAMSNLGLLYEKQGRYDEAEPLIRTAFEEGRHVLGLEHPFTLIFMNNLGMLCDAVGRYDEAESLYLQLLEIRERLRGEEHEDTQLAMFNLATLYDLQGRYDQAEPLYSRALELLRRTLGEEHPRTILAMSNLASLYISMGRYDEAESMHTEILEVQRQVLGEEHLETLKSLSNLALLYQRQGRYDEAKRLISQTVEAKCRVLGDEHPATVHSLGQLAMVCHILGQFEEAETLYVRVARLTRQKFGDRHVETIMAVGNLGSLYTQQERYEEAESMLAPLLQTALDALGQDHTTTLNCMQNLGIIYLETKRFEKAEPLFTKALEVSQRGLGNDNPTTLECLNSLATLYLEQGRYHKAEPLYVRALEIQQRVLPEEHLETLVAMNNLGELYLKLNRPNDALQLLTVAIQGGRRSLPAGHWVTAVFLTNYGACLTRLERHDEAEAALLAAHETLSATWGAAHEHTLNANQALVDLYDAWNMPEKSAYWQAKLPTAQPHIEPTSHPSTQSVEHAP